CAAPGVPPPAPLSAITLPVPANARPSTRTDVARCRLNESPSVQLTGARRRLQCLIRTAAGVPHGSAAEPGGTPAARSRFASMSYFVLGGLMSARLMWIVGVNPV